MVFEHQDYRVFLKTALNEKAKSREGYTLRAFSQKLGVSNSFLSEVLSSKKSLSMELAFKIAVKLDLTDRETQYFCLLVQLEHEGEPDFREELARRLQALNPKRPVFDLSVDLFRIVADWHHYAILELTYLPGFRLEATEVARRLGIPKLEAELAIDRLKRLELLEETGDGRYRKTRGYVLAQSSVPNSALKSYHKQLLEKAIASVDSQVPSERLSETHILPIDRKHLPEVDRLSREFSSAVLRLAEKSKVRDAVYALTVHFFSLMDQERDKR
ncbi:MAG TPA: TIGR02147 family protein [Bdellovibrionota bacterium]|nr:TIGR02147 family protein [Bdellovibrionota bacterium]